VSQPTLSLIVLGWDHLELTRQCVASLQEGTTSSHELIIVDNGSSDGTAGYAKAEADKAVVNPENLGFAAGNNSGLALAEGDYVAFINNDTTFPASWDVPLVTDFDRFPNAGIVAPAVTAAGNPVTVRQEVGTDVDVLLPFGEFPSGVVYLARTETMKALGGWNEDYLGASAEDLDLAFTMWAHGLDVVLDTRTLVNHVSQASMREIPGLPELYRRNLEQFLNTWEQRPEGPRLQNVEPETYERNLDRAQTAVRWIRRMIAARDTAKEPARSESEKERRRSFFKSS
jgi:GT2 family glycosyltransferase